MKLHLNTVSNLLWVSLKTLMNTKEFETFRIVGGTSLSLQLGHRESIDIDLFTDAEYGSLDFDILETKLQELFPYVDAATDTEVGMGKSYFIGNNPSDLVKLDLFYTDPFVFPVLIVDEVRFASIEEVAAMKLEVVASNGRKKDFWDIHELLEKFEINTLFEYYLKRYPYSASREDLIEKLVDFEIADDEFTPNCYKDKDWDIIKLDFIDLHASLTK